MKLNRIVGWVCWVVGVCCWSVSAVAQESDLYQVQVPYNYQAGKIMIEATVNQVKGRFLIDTGAPCCVSYTFAQKASIDVQGQMVSVEDSNGQTSMLPIVSLQTLSLDGKTTFRHLDAMVWDEGNPVEDFGVDGIIGYNLFKQGILGFDSQAHMLMFTNSGEGLDRMAGHFAIPMIADRFLTLLPVQLGEQACDTVMFDSGAEAFYEVSTKSFQRLEKQPDVMSVLGKGEGVLSLGAAGLEQKTLKHRVCFPQLRLGSLDFQQVTSITTEAADSRLGTGILRYGKVIIDYLQNRFFYIPYHPQESPNLYEKEWDVVITSMNGHLYAGMVWDYAHLPLKGGEQIVEVNGQDTEEVDTIQLLSGGFLQMKGDEAEIVYMDSKGKRQKVTIRRR